MITFEWEAYLLYKQAQFGKRFDASELSGQFVPYFKTNYRIKVKMRWGDVLTGRVGVTSGWKPVFLLMRRRSDLGSSIVLTDKEKIIGTKHDGDRKYTEVK